MVDISVFKTTEKKTKEQNFKSLVALVKTKSYVEVNIDGHKFMVKRLGINELKLIEKIKDNTKTEEIINILREILGHILMIDDDVIKELDDGIIFYIFIKIVEYFSKELGETTENFQKQ